jgi:hypothetical protein
MRNVKLRQSMMFGVASLLVACTTPIGAPTGLPSCPAPGDASYFDFWRALRMQSAANVAAVAQHYAARTDPPSRLRYAMALAAPWHPERDEAHAMHLAEEVAEVHDATPATREAAAWFVAWLIESRRNDLATRRTQSDAKRIEQLEARARDSERRASDAEHKLDALKKIDRELTERPSSRTARP